MNAYANDYTQTVRTYYNELKKCKPMTAARERKLIKQCKKGDTNARNLLLEANLRFVFDVARKYTGRGVPISELISEGNMALITAINKFNPSFNIKFISYAVWWIRSAMQEAIKRNAVSNFVEIAPQESNDKHMDSLVLKDDEDDNDKSTNMISLMADQDEQWREIEENQKKAVSNFLSQLEEREKRVMMAYFGIGENKEQPLQDIGEAMNLTSERVRQIKNVALRKLRTVALTSNKEDMENLFHN